MVAVVADPEVDVGDLAETYFRLRGLQEQLRIAQQNADNQAQTLRLIDLRRSAGMGSAVQADRLSRFPEARLIK